MTTSTPLSRNNQRGVALLVALVFLIVLTLLGLATMRGTTLQERMAGGSRDYNIALQAAEAALRDAELDLSGLGTRPVSYGSFPILTYWATGAATNTGCPTAIAVPPTNGLCVIDTATVQQYLTGVDWTSTPSLSSVVYGTYTNAQPIPGVSQQPRYFMELMRWTPLTSGTFTNPFNGGTEGIYTYFYVRITARAWGASAQTQVYLQEVFLVPLTGA
jgi:type IV pilus assembly protein PilX